MEVRLIRQGRPCEPSAHRRGKRRQGGFMRNASANGVATKVLRAQTSPRRKGSVFHYKYLYLMLLPGFLYLLIMSYLPMFGAIIAFKRIDYALGILKSPWYGLKNFEFLFATGSSWTAIFNTLAYNSVFIVTGPIFSCGIALILNELLNKRGAKVFQTLLIMPHFVSYVVASYLVYAFLATNNGYLNTTVLPMLGLQPVKWYLESQHWPVILFLVNGWKTWGFGTVIYLATISTLDAEIFEAATIDGASRITQIRRITLPLILPIVVLLFILSLGRIFYSDFGLFYQIPRGSGALTTTQTLDTYVYRALIQLSDISMSSAASFVQSVVGFITIFVVNLVMRRLKPEWSVF
jgi:putative aldouronate transport system permease protein